MNNKLIQQDHPLLHQPCATVSKRKGRKIARQLISQIKEHKPIAIGMSANQIGLPYRVAVVQIDPDEKPLILINPEIIKKDYQIKALHEGCMSYPGEQKKVVRYGWIKVKTATGEFESGSVKPEWDEYLKTIAIQHEIDHLNGITIMDKCLKPITGSTEPKRNSPCYCGSEKKYKQCCMLKIKETK